MSVLKQKPEIPYAGEVPLLPNVRPIILVSGSDNNMGYQWYSQIVDIYGKRELENRSHKKLTRKDRSALSSHQTYIKKHVPNNIELLYGMVDGANDAGINLSYEKILAKWLRSREINNPENDETTNSQSENDCSGFAAWGSATKDGKLICGGSGDHQMLMGESEILNFEYIIAFFPDKGNNFIISTSTGCCWHPGMNNKGVAMFHHGCTGYLYHYQGPEKKQVGIGIPNQMITMNTLRFANTANEALELVLSLPSIDERVGGSWADVNGNAFVIENRNDPRIIRKPGDNGERDFLYSTNNMFSKEYGQLFKPPPENKHFDYAGKKGLDGQAYVTRWQEEPKFIMHAGWFGRNKDISSVTRNLELWNMLNYYHSRIDLEFSEMLWRFPGDQPSYPTLEEADASWFKKRGAGWNAYISDLKNAMVGLLQPDNGTNGVYHVSQGSLARLTSPLKPGGHFYRIDPTYSFYQIKLDSTIENVLVAARDQAQYDQYYANLELRKLNYHDYAYTPLNALFNQAAIEWQKGEYYFKYAKNTKGNTSKNYYAKAIRAFTRCQALAKQVYNELVPPADSPEDLGLQEWEYWKK